MSLSENDSQVSGTCVTCRAASGGVAGLSGRHPMQRINYLLRSRLRDRRGIDYYARLSYKPHILAHLRGRLRRRAEGGAGSGVLRRRLVTVLPREARDPARQALRPGCEELAERIRRKCRRRKRGPRPKIATVERREASASRWTRAAPRQAWTVARHERDNRQLAPFGAPLAPHGG